MMIPIMMSAMLGDLGGMGGFSAATTSVVRPEESPVVRSVALPPVVPVLSVPFPEDAPVRVMLPVVAVPFALVTEPVVVSLRATPPVVPVEALTWPVVALPVVLTGAPVPVVVAPVVPVTLVCVSVLS